MRSNFNYQNLIYYIIIITPVVYYFFLVIRYTVNVPYADDFFTLQFSATFIDANFYEKIRLLYNQVNEHRILTYKLAFLTDYYVFGKISFKHLIVLGNIGLIGILWVLYKSNKLITNQIYYFLPISYIIFQLQHWENTGFSTSSIQVFYVTFFALLSLWCLNQPNKIKFILAIIFGVLATFSSGNGLFVFFAGTVLLLSQKRFKPDLVIWVIIGSFLVFIYYYDLKPTGTNPKGYFLSFKEDIDKVIGGFFAGLGGALNFDKAWEPRTWGFTLSIIIGYFISAFFLYLLVIKYFKKNSFLFSALIFFLFTYASIALSRANFYTVFEFSTISRYKISSTIILVVIYLIVLDLISEKARFRLSIVFLLFAITYNYLGFSKNIDVFKIHNDRLVTSSWLVYQKNDYTGLISFDPNLAKRDLKKAEKKKAYQLPNLSDEYVNNTFRSNQISSDLIKKAQDSTIIYDFELINTAKKNIYAVRKGWAFVKGKSSSGCKIYIVLKSINKTYLFDTEYQYRADVVEKYQKEHPDDKNYYNDCGFNFSFETNKVAKGKYSISIFIVNFDGSQTIKHTNKIIII